MIYLLDTDHISELQGIAVAGRRLTARLGRIAPDDYGTTIITFEEQVRGTVGAGRRVESYCRRIKCHILCFTQQNVAVLPQHRRLAIYTRGSAPV